MILLSGKSLSITLNASEAGRSLRRHIYANQTIQIWLGTTTPPVVHSGYFFDFIGTEKMILLLTRFFYFLLLRDRNMETCITPLPEPGNPNDIAGGALEKWPERAFAVPPRISSGSIPGITPEKFKEDNALWKERVEHYKNKIPISKGRYRNVMDMNAYLGGFAAALSKYPVWVMNTVPANTNQDTLGVIYERGFIGTYQDWCEAFSTYPRTYDLIHAANVFSIYQDR